MPLKQAIYKVPNGKLLKVFLEAQDGRIVSVKITGDFFIHPEEKIEAIEAALMGEPLEEAVLKTKLETVIWREGLELFGVDPESVAKTILMAAA